jgi:hypothetical protein
MASNMPAVEGPFPKADPSVDEYSKDAGKDEKAASASTGVKFFTYATLPLLPLTAMTALIYVVPFCFGFGWSRNPAAVCLDLEEKPWNPHSGVVTAHALTAAVIMLLAIVEVLSGFNLMDLANKSEGTSSCVHRINGYLTAFIWTVVCALGFCYSFMARKSMCCGGEASLSDKQDEADSLEFAYGVVVAWIVGIGSLVNLLVGCAEVLNKPKEEQDMVLHVGCMFFTLYYILSSSLGTIMLTVFQLFMSHCGVGTLGLLICVGISQTAQLAAFMMAGRRWGGEHFRRPFVRYNLYVLIFRTILVWLGFFVVLSNPPDDNNVCF